MQAGQLLPAGELLSPVLDDAEGREKARRLTGKPVLGLPTGIPKLDEILNGLDPGLYLLAGGPSVGKTSLAEAISVAVARVATVVYVSFENSPRNLVLKAICAEAGMNPREVRRGFADLSTLAATAAKWAGSVAPRLNFIEGSSQLYVPRLELSVRQAMNRDESARCLIVVDYLQVWA